MLSLNKKAYWLIGLSFTLLLGVMAPVIYAATLVALITLTLRPYIQSVFDRFVLSLSIAMCLTITYAVIFWLVKLPFDPFMIFALHAVTCIGLIVHLMLSSKWHTAKVPLRPRIGLPESFAIALSSLIFILLATPLLLKYNTNYIFQFFVFGGDNLTHLELSKVVEKNEGLLYEDVNMTRDALTVNSTAYPQGLAITMYTAREYVGTFVTIDTPKKELYLFTLISSFLYAVMGYVWTRIAFFLVQSTKRPGFGLSLFTSLLLAILLLGPFLHFYTNGFQTHIVSLILFGQMLLVAGSLTGKARSGDAFRIALLFMLNIGISFTWLFLAPVSLLVSGIIFLLRYKNDIFNKRIVRFIRSHVVMLGLALLFVIVCFIQVYVQLAYGIKDDSINEPGYILHPEQGIITLSALAPLLVFLLNAPRKAKNPTSKELTFLVFSATSTLFALAIYAYQVLSVGNPEYYYFKVAYHLILIGAVSLPALLVSLSIVSARPKSILAVGYVFVFITGLVALPVHLPSIISGTVNGMSSGLANAYGNIVDTDPSSTDNIIAVGSCNRQQDYLLTRLSGIQGDANTYLRQSIAFGIINDWTVRSELIEKYQRSLAESDQQLIVLDDDSQPDLLPSDVTGSAQIVYTGGTVIAPEACPSRFQGLIETDIDGTKDVRPF